MSGRDEGIGKSRDVPDGQTHPIVIIRIPIVIRSVNLKYTGRGDGEVNLHLVLHQMRT